MSEICHFNLVNPGNTVSFKKFRYFSGNIVLNVHLKELSRMQFLAIFWPKTATTSQLLLQNSHTPVDPMLRISSSPMHHVQDI